MRVDEDSHHLQGVFQAAFDLRDNSKLEAHEEAELSECLDWLKMHLKAPDCLKDPENYRALSWFKPEAHKPMQYVWRMVQILEEHNVLIEVHKTNDPGIVIYEDGWQIVAKPRRNRS